MFLLFGITFIFTSKREGQQDEFRRKINFLNLDDLIIAKKNTGRLQDLADAEQLAKIKKKENT